MSRSLTVLAFLVTLVAAGVFIGVVITFGDWDAGDDDDSEFWSASDQVAIRQLWIGLLGTPPPDPSNRVADDERAASLGHRLFFDERLSVTGTVACATCHQPEQQFSDGLERGRGVGESGRNTRSIVGSAFSPFQYWDGRRDSLWSQALSPLEDPMEHGSDRMSVVRLIATDPGYRQGYEPLFGPLPAFDDPVRFPARAAPGLEGGVGDAWQAMSAADRDLVSSVFANVGKMIAAYERLIVPGASAFDAYVEAMQKSGGARQQPELGAAATRGLGLFVGRGRCTECHNGPLMTNNEFHNTGILSAPGELPDRGRIDGVREVLANPFNCLGRFSDDPVKRCDEMRYVREGKQLIGSMRTPSLRNSGATAPYMHRGQTADLADAMRHYNTAPDSLIGHNEAKPLVLSDAEVQDLVRFVEAVASPVAADPVWLRPPGLRQRGLPPREE